MDPAAEALEAYKRKMRRSAYAWLAVAILVVVAAIAFNIFV